VNAIALAPARDSALDSATLDIRSLVRSAVANWKSQPVDFPYLGVPFGRLEQRGRERRADQCVSAVEAALRRMARTDTNPARTLQDITAHVVSFIPEALDLDNGSPVPQLRSLLNDGLAEVGLALARRARELDPSVSIVDILQAARNAWVACGLQLMLGKPMRLTPSIFAYSMLYPYSDNFLDDKAITREAKLRFSYCFERRLEGERLSAGNQREAIIWELVGMIEDEYSRDEYPDVWASVLAIHRAQTRSISQMHRTRELEHTCHYNANLGAANSASETLDLTFTKGGTSVLVDAYLAAGHLSGFEAKVAFDWGVVLQLGDDLQDLHGDRDRGSLTVFTGAAAFGPLDGVTNKTFRFSQRVMNEVASLSSCPPMLTSLLDRSSRMFLIRSVSGSPKFFNRSYLEQLEQYSPFRFMFLKSRERRCCRRRRDYGRLFERVV
jgi:hypothetical protein